MNFKNKTKRTIMLIVATLTLALSILTVYSNSNVNKVSADELDPASKILCKFEDGQEFVRFYSTDYFYYMFRSKSAVTSIQPVDSSWLNKLLELAGHDFKKANESILGRELRPSEMPEESQEVSNEKTPKVSAFDRFGVAGLKWSSYQGEWKYYHVDPCSAQSASPTTFGTFYEGRLEPQSTHNETITSDDARSIQFNKGVASTFITAFVDTVSNGLFSLTKGIVTLTIVFVGLSFSDVTEVFGMLGKGENAGTADGVFTSLFEGLFSGFIYIFITITAMYILYMGLIKRQVRYAMSSLIRIILVFIIAIVMASNPTYWISLPNKATTYGQALIINAMSPTYEKNSKQISLCSTNVSSIVDGVDLDLSKENNFKSEFDKTNENMRSMIACNMWESLLFKPWIKGQFGSDYDYKDLNADNVKNNNSEWVGIPEVPLGDGNTVKNWALFHLSTQTNAHSTLGENNMPILINNVNADWWRIVDALSDYEEYTSTEVDDEGVQHTFNLPVEDKPTTEFWQSWIGNNKLERFGVAIVSIIFGIVGSIAPLTFGLASAIFGLGITLLMMTAPVFLLFGLWGGRGEKIFLGWLSSLLNTILKKIVTSILLILSIFLSTTIIELSSDIGYIKSVILMIIVSTILVKNRTYIYGLMANVNFGGAFDPTQKASQIFNAHKQVASEVSRIAAGAAGGGVAAYKSGQKISSGVALGVNRQLKNRLYTSRTGMNVIRQMDVQRGGDKITNHTCITCHRPLGVAGSGIETAYRDDYGNYYCTFCAEEMGLEKMSEVIVGTESNEAPIDKAMREGHSNIKQDDVRTVNATLGKSTLTHREMKDIMNMKKEGDEYTWNEDNVREAIKENIKGVQEDFVVFKNVQLKIGRRVAIPPTPEPLHDYIDLPLINMAWEQGRFEVIEASYKEAWKQWYLANSGYIANSEYDEASKFVKEIEHLDYSVDKDKALKLLGEFFSTSRMEDFVDGEEESVYIMRDGKLTLYDHDIDVRNKDLS